MGAELTFNIIHQLGLAGGFAQAQVMNDEALRLCGGFQFMFTFAGVELGGMHETASQQHTSATGLHIAPYLAIPYGSVGVDWGLVLTLKLPFEVTRRGLTPMVN